MRQLVTLRTIDDIQTIPNADRIDVAIVGGWRVVVKKGEFNVGDEAFYFEIDSWIPRHIAPFLCTGEPKFYEGVEGSLLKTIKLKGQISQGLLLPVDYVEPLYLDNNSSDNLAERLGVVKYEPIVESSGHLPFPSYLNKTDQERIQNIDLPEYKVLYQVTEKLDGSSMTVFNSKEYEESGVCSRNVLFTPDTINDFTQTADKLNILDIIRCHGLSIAIQGELIGPKIQGNSYGLKELDFYIYNIWDINDQEYWSTEQVEDFCDEYDLNHVPVSGSLSIDSDTNIEDLLTYADGYSYLNPSTLREGLVFKSYYTQRSFKVISNKWLLKQK